jgi:hypothetical protein
LSGLNNIRHRHNPGEEYETLHTHQLPHVATYPLGYH